MILKLHMRFKIDKTLNLFYFINNNVSQALAGDVLRSTQLSNGQALGNFVLLLRKSTFQTIHFTIYPAQIEHL